MVDPPANEGRKERRKDMKEGGTEGHERKKEGGK
jgi:hypothetical protein